MMRRGKMHILTILLGATLAAAGPLPARGTIWEVEVGRGLPTVSAAVARAAAGDTVRVHPGTYPEHGILIDKPLYVLGVGRPAIDGREEGTIVTVTADRVHIEGLVFRNVGVSYMEDRAGVRLQAVRDCEVLDNQFVNTFFGVYLENSEACRVRGNRLAGVGTRETTTANGIHLWYCRNILIEDNHVSGHRDGIYFEFVESSVIKNNVSEGNVRYGLHFMFSNDDVYEGNVFRRNGAGVAVMFSDRVRMSGNQFVDNWGPASYGLLLKDIRDSDIASNLFRRNTIGIYAEGSLRLDVHHNEFTSNGYALKIMASSSDNGFRDNNFIGNTFDVSTNSRQNFNTFDGNYWSRYQGYDLDNNGVGDIPHRPVHLFTLLIEREPAGLVLLRSFFIDLLDAAERVMPLYTPATLLDHRPFVSPVTTDWRTP